jgi:hypothetical protein
MAERDVGVGAWRRAGVSSAPAGDGSRRSVPASRSIGLISTKRASGAAMPVRAAHPQRGAANGRRSTRTCPQLSEARPFAQAVTALRVRRRVFFEIRRYARQLAYPRLDLRSAHVVSITAGARFRDAAHERASDPADDAREVVTELALEMRIDAADQARRTAWACASSASSHTVKQRACAIAVSVRSKTSAIRRS